MLLKAHFTLDRNPVNLCKLELAFRTVVTGAETLTSRPSREA